jgi:hypothetical protein
MARTQTPFDLLVQVADDLDITFVTGQLWPPYNGQMWFGDRTLSDILLPDSAPRHVAGVFASGGPTWDHVRIGRGVLDSEGLARLAQVAAEMGGNVYQGRLALITPAEWLKLHSGDVRAELEQERGHREGAEIRGVDAEPLLDKARAAGWPPNFGDEPVLFLGDEPIFNLLATENAGRNVTLLVGDIAEQLAPPTS